MSDKDESATDQPSNVRAPSAITNAFSKLRLIVYLIAKKFWSAKALLVLIIGILFIGYYLKTSNGYIATEARFFWHFFVNNKYFQENEKMKDITVRTTEVSKRWDNLRGLDNPASIDQQYVRENIEDLYDILQSVDPTVFKYRQRVMYHYVFIKIHIIYSALKKDTSYLDNIEEPILAIREIINSKGNTSKDVKFYMEYLFMSRLQHMKFNIAALRQLYSTNSVTKEILEQALEAFGGCRELRRKGVIFKPFYEATGCSCKGMIICL